MNITYTNLFRFFFALVDFLAINIIHLALLLNLNRVHGNNSQNYTILFIVINIAWMGCAYITGLYINDQFFNFERFAKRTVQAFALFITTILLFLFLYNVNYSRLFVSLNIIGIGAALLFSRIVFISGVTYFGKQERFNKRIVLLGYNELSKQLVNYFSTNSKSISIEGYFEDYQNINELSVFPILGNRDECVSYAIAHNVKEIYSTISPEKHSYVYELAQTAEKNMIRFKFVPDFRMFVNRNIHVDIVESIPILSFRSEPLEDIVASSKKRVFDVFFSLFIIVFLLSWLVPLLAILIKLNSRGPIFFVQSRSGKDNKEFKCFKFRTLTVNTDSDSKQVTRDDNRFTKLGKFLRKTSLDELPQFFNVLLGDMSVVGPRPHMLKHTEDYSRILDEYMIRHFVKPGVTGWAQVNGFRGEIKEQDQLRKRIEHDIWYLENWSLWLDLRIIFLTFYVTFKGDKNAF
ncbi:MAG: undecaprenyl-phosphate glucose phosphotransferase [Ferruginibacter sp.]|nr:undecaprenyl-phosphate glucose phosphotransferase [Ferruginibacter sp.]